VRIAGARALVNEAKSLGLAVREEADPPSAGSIVVTGVLAEQLAKELGAGAAPGAVVTAAAGSLPSRVEILVHVVAGDPSEEDEALVDDAVARGIGVVIVELWPQPDWTRPFVLSPFVVECRAGEGFPLDEIAARIVEASETPSVLAAEVPAIADVARAGLVKEAVLRSALIGFAGARLGASRPLLSLEQVRMITRLRGVSSGRALGDELPVLAGGAAAVALSGLAFRNLARSARTFLPAPVVHAAVAAGGTWAIAKAFQLLESRLPTP
jgi:hypothetical protein